MIYHIHNGGALASQFGRTHIEGTWVVMREGMIDGDLSGCDEHEFFTRHKVQTRRGGYKIGYKDV